MELSWQSAEECHRGKRRATNEDAVMSRPSARLWAVADGMGGHKSGEVASSAIAEALRSLPLNGNLADDLDAVEDALCGVNERLREHARVTCPGGTVGSTVVAMLALARVGVALWAGDSRLYRLRGRRLEQITRDHNPVSDLLDSGAVSEAEALAADTNIVTRAVGGHSDLFLDVAVFDIDPQDTYLLCSDGLYRELGMADLAQALQGESPDQIAKGLLGRCLETAARDNVSLIIARPGVT
jgi:serine/threonine protein phosphatase PrpC